MPCQGRQCREKFSFIFIDICMDIPLIFLNPAKIDLDMSESLTGLKKWGMGNLIFMFILIFCYNLLNIWSSYKYETLIKFYSINLGPTKWLPNLTGLYLTFCRLRFPLKKGHLSLKQIIGTSSLVVYLIGFKSVKWGGHSKPLCRNASFFGKFYSSMSNMETCIVQLKKDVWETGYCKRQQVELEYWAYVIWESHIDEGIY